MEGNITDMAGDDNKRFTAIAKEYLKYLEDKGNKLIASDSYVEPAPHQ